MPYHNKLLTLFLILITNACLLAGSTGKIAGVVKEKSTGEPLIGVNLVLENTTLGASTDLDGSFIILNVPPGTYTLVADYIGYTTVRLENIKVSVDLTTEGTFEMQEAAIELGDVVTVTADRQLITKDLTASTAKVDAERIESLPVTEVSEVLELQAGFLEGHVRGGRSGEVTYMIDGIPVTDAFDGGQVVEVNTGVVEELQFISGAFNAEYGEALSGIVNITTKEPTVDFGGNFTAYFGDYVSSHDDIFLNTGNYDPGNILNFEGTLFGTIVPSKLSYLLNARYIDFGGWLYGQRVYNPQNIAFEDSAGNFVQFRDPEGEGDGEYVSMNGNRKLYFQGKLIYNISPLMKVSYSFIRDDVEFQDFDRNYLLNPGGNLNKFRLGYTHLFKLSHTLNKSTFYELGFSFFDKTFQEYVYEDINDPRYVHPKINDNQQLYSYKTGGTNDRHFYRNTKSLILKLDLTSQVNNRHLIKTGFEFRRHNINFDEIELRPAEGDELDFRTGSPYMTPLVFPISSNFHSTYQHEPLQLSAYIQDKMEFEDLIVNIGVRVDHFQPDGVVLADPSDPNIFNPLKPEHRFKDLNGNGIQDAGEPFITLEERQTFWYKDAGNKTQFSPRLGAAFPISPTGVIHFSYGHFFQIPIFELLYRNPQFKLGTGTGNQGTIGNADLRPEQTISGELGLQQQLSEQWVTDVTAYFRDIRDLTGTRADQIDVFGGSQTYSKLVNSDFGFVKGFIISLKKRFTQGFNATIDYNFQVADGTASDPNAAQQAFAAGNQPEVQLVPLEWDQRHTLTATLGYNGRSWGINFINVLGSGQSYTPRQTADVSELRENSGKKPTIWNVDMRFNKDLYLFDKRLTLFLRVFNLFDRLNEVNVFDDTGRAGFTTDLERIRALNPTLNVNTLDQWFKRPTHFAEPRRVEFGLMFGI
jgi:outer membrane receptor protein involved in Fe transport